MLEAFDSLQGPQATTASILRDLRAIAKALLADDAVAAVDDVRDSFESLFAQGSLHTNPSLTIRLHLSYCSAAAFRRFAPIVPCRSKPALIRIFELFSTVLGVQFMSSADIDMLFFISEILWSTDAHLLVFDDRIAGELVDGLLQNFHNQPGIDFALNLLNSGFSIPNRAQSRILANILNPTVQYLGRNLRPELKAELIRRAPEILPKQDFIQKVPQIARCFDIPFPFLLDALEGDVISENDTKRLEAVQVLSSIVSSEIAEIDEQWLPTIDLLLARNNDRNDQIRARVVSLCFQLFDVSIITQKIRQILETRLSDPSERVRLQCLANARSRELSYKRCLKDKSAKVAKAALDILCGEIEAGKSDIEPLLASYATGPKIQIFRVVRRLLHNFDFVQLFEKSGVCQTEFFEVMADLANLSERAEEIVCAFAPKSFQPAGWERFLPSPEIWRNIGDRAAIERMTTPEFADELYAIVDPVTVPVDIVLASRNPSLIKRTAKIFPRAFVPFVDEILDSGNFVKVIERVFPFVDDKVGTLLRVSSVSLDTALLCSVCLNPIVTKSFVRTGALSIAFEECSFLACLRFFVRMRLPAPASLFPLPGEVASPREMKWILRASQFLPFRDSLNWHLAFAPRIPVDVLASFFAVVSPGELSASEFRTFAKVINNHNAGVRQRALTVVHESLKKPATNVHWLAMIAFCLADSHDSVREYAESSVKYHAKLRRMANSAITAEYAIPALLNLVVWFQGNASCIQMFLDLLAPELGQSVLAAVRQGANQKSQFGGRLAQLCGRFCRSHARAELEIPDVFVADKDNDLDGC
jgi:hypothetical protein